MFLPNQTKIGISALIVVKRKRQLQHLGRVGVSQANTITNLAEKQVISIILVGVVVLKFI
jgi:hypothetical protein